MSYDRVRESLNRYRKTLENGDASTEQLAHSLEALAGAVEKDFAQIKAALGHLATLLEQQRQD